MPDAPTFRMSDGVHEHRKIVAAGGDAGWLWVCSIAWSHRIKTEGVIPATWAMKVSDRKNPERLIGILVRERLFHEPGHDCASCPQPLRGSYVIHDYLDWQQSAIANRRMREAKGEGGAYGNHLRWHVTRGVLDSECRYCVGATDQNGSHDRSHMRSLSDSSSDDDASRSTDGISESLDSGAKNDHGLFPKELTPPIVPPTEAGNRSSDHGKPKARTRRQAYDYADDLDFQRFWAAFPVKSGKPAAYKAWLAARQRGADPELIVTAAKRYADDPRRDPAKTKYPQGWLNDERYNDGAQEPGGGDEPYDWEA